MKVQSLYLSAFITLALLFGITDTAFSLPDTVSPVAILGVTLNGPTGIALDEKAGKYYIADQASNKVFSVDISTGVATILAGDAGGAAGYNGDNILATAAQLNEPTGVAVDANGNVYVADRLNHRVRKIDPVSGIITAVAGNGVAGFYGDGGLPTSAGLKQPTGVTIDKSGILYVADNGNYRVRKVVDAGLSTATISTIAGDGTAPTLTPYSVALLAPVGDLYITDSGNNVIQKLSGGKLTIVAGDKTNGYSGDGGLATKAQLNQPSGIVIDGLGDIYFTDSINNSVRKITLSTGVISTRTGNSVDPRLEPAITAAPALNVPFGLASDDAGNLYVMEYGNQAVRKITASVSAVTTASPPGGNFTTDTKIALIANKTVQKIYYTDDNSAPLTSLTKKIYTAPITITPTKILKFASIDLAGNNEVTNTATYFAPTNTTATPAAGLYNAAQSVVLAASPVAPAIHYTIDGTEPTLVSAAYVAPIAVAATTTLKFFAVDAFGNQETTQTKVYTIDTTAPTTTASPVGATYTAAQTVTLTADDSSATIYYTTTGTDPTITTTNKYDSKKPITISKSTTLKFFAVDLAANKEIVKIQNYVIDSTAPVTSAYPKAGSYTAVQSVVLTADDPAAIIHFTADGTDPTIASPIYAAPIVVNALNATTTIKFFAVDAIGNVETTKTLVYIIDTITPNTTVTPAGGAYTAAQTVVLTASEPTATIYYTLTGAVPTTASTTKGVGSVTLAVNSTTTLKYFSADVAGNKETVQTQLYTIDSTAPVTTASLKDGTYTSIQTVKLAINDALATIFYTTDGSNPTILSPKYTTPLSISKTTTLKYFAQDSVGNTETVKTNTYTIISVATTARPAGGVFASDQTVVLENNVDKAVIYYTTDGSVPTTTSKTTLKYATPVLLTATTVLQYFAVDVAGIKEPVKTQLYTIDKVIPATTATCDIIGNTVDLKAADASDPAPQIKYNLNGGVWTDYAGPFSMPAQNSIISFFAVDLANNAEQLKNIACLYVGTAPALNLETLPDNSITTNSVLYVKGMVAPATATVTVNGNPVAVSASGSFSTKLVLAAGANAIPVVATSGSATTVTRNITYNAPAALPQLSLAYPDDNISVIGSSVLLTGTVRAPSTNVAVSVNAVNQPVHMLGNSFTASVSLVSGINVITIKATDIDGTFTTITRNVTFLSSGPALYVTTPANDNNSAVNPITLQGLVSTNAPPVTLSYLQSNATTGVITPGADGVFSQILTLPAGSSWIQVTAVDTNGSTTIQRNMTLNQPIGTVTVEAGAVNAVIGYVAAVPLTLSSGYQASSLSIDIGYDPNKLTSPKAELSSLALASGKSISTNIQTPGIFRILIPGTTLTPIPDGVVAYVTFGVASTTLGSTALTTVSTVSDADSNILNLENRNGAVAIMSKPGDLNGDGFVMISEVQSAINMFLGSISVADGVVDLNGDHEAEISELQKVVNSFMGL